MATILEASIVRGHGQDGEVAPHTPAATVGAAPSTVAERESLACSPPALKAILQRSVAACALGVDSARLRGPCTTSFLCRIPKHMERACGLRRKRMTPDSLE
jgi:hypothetical protein